MPNRARGGREHHREPAADAAIGQALEAQQRLFAAPLDDDEGDKTGESRAADQEGLRGGPTGVCGLGEGEDDRGEAAGGERGASEIEAAPRGC